MTSVMLALGQPPIQLGGEWSPGLEPSLVLRFDPSNPAHYTLDTGLVSQALDLSPAASHGVQTTPGNRFTIAPAAMNGLDAFDLSAGGWLELPDNSLVPSGQNAAPLTVLAVVSFTTSTQWRYLLTLGSSGTRLGVLFQNQRFQPWSLDMSTVTVPTDGTPTVVAFVIDAADLWHFQGPEHHSYGTGVSPPVISDAVRRFGIGPAGTLGLGGLCGEVLAYRGVLPPSALGAGMNYLNTKWVP